MNWRTLHRWLSILIALPFLVILLSGLLLASRSFLPWMDPGVVKPEARQLAATFPQILSSVKSAPEAGMQSWEDVSQIDIRPATGLIRVRAKKGHWEVQIDGKTGAVLRVGQRRVSWFTSLHQGALFGPYVRYGIFLPSSFALFFLFVSGLWLFAKPHWRRLRKPKPERKPHASL
jgi:uncharacterized iron-regulated membrane protein